MPSDDIDNDDYERKEQGKKEGHQQKYRYILFMTSVYSIADFTDVTILNFDSYKENINEKQDDSKYLSNPLVVCLGIKLRQEVRKAF